MAVVRSSDAYTTGEILHVRKLALPADILPSIPQLRDHCRIYGTHHDMMLTSYRDTAIEMVENETGYGVGESVWQLTASLHNRKTIELPRYPLGSGDVLCEVDGVEVGYVIDYGDSTLPVITFDVPQTGFFEVTWQAGKPSPLALGAVRLLVGHLYEHREVSTSEALRVVPVAYERLLALLSPSRGAW